MKFFLLLSGLLFAVSVLTTNAQSRKVFPYQYKTDDLPNGLRVVTVPTDYPNLVSMYIVVGAGSRNEIEDKKSGYAHFFEHLMFRGSENFPAGRFDEIMKKAGASSNAYTSDDRTVYHETFAKEDLDEIMQLEADRFQKLKFPEEKFKTEAGAVLGEYNKNSANPTFKMYEVLRETAFQKHTYSHTTMGYIADIKDYPNQYDYAWQFFNRFYRPENTTMVIVGDVKPEQILAMVKKYWSGWKRGDYKQTIPVEPAQTEARSQHIACASNIDPELFTVTAQVKDVKDLNYVRDEIVKTYKRYATELIPQKQLDETRSRQRYGFSLAMNSNDAIAGTLASFVSLRRSPDTIDKVFALYDSITPEDIKKFAAKYFAGNNQTIITLAAKKGDAK